MRDIQTLAEAYFADPTPANREAIVLASVPLIRSIIGRLHTPNHPCLAYEDLQGVGLLGLIEALDRYDPSRGVRFASFAYNRVRGAVIDFIRLVDMLPRYRRRDVSEARKAFDTLCQDYGKAPDEREVAEYLGISVEQYTQLLQDAQRRNVLSLNSVLNGEEGAPSLSDFVSEDADEAFEQIESASAIDRLKVLVDQLPEREQEIVQCYYYEGLTQREIGMRLSVSEARVSQVLSKILRKLRAGLAEPALALA